MLLHEGPFKITSAATAGAASTVAGAAPIVVIRASTPNSKPRKDQLKPAKISHWVRFRQNVRPL